MSHNLDVRLQSIWCLRAHPGKRGIPREAHDSQHDLVRILLLTTWTEHQGATTWPRHVGRYWPCAHGGTDEDSRLLFCMGIDLTLPRSQQPDRQRKYTKPHSAFLHCCRHTIHSLERHPDLRDSIQLFSPHVW